MVDRVEYHVGQTKDHVELGRTELTAAHTYQRKARRVGHRKNPNPITH